MINDHRFTSSRAFMTLLVFVISITMWAQEMNPKFSFTTQLFLDEQREQAEKPANAPGRNAERSHDDLTPPEVQSLVASPVTIDGVQYISCFIHLADPSDLSAVRALGVKVMQTFPKLDFVTALAPVAQLDALAEIDNVKTIRVSKRMRPMTDAARNLTHVDDVLNLSSDAKARGLKTKYDGSGVLIGVLDVGIDFQHIAFKDTAGNTRIKQALAYNEDSLRLFLYDEGLMHTNPPTTDNSYEDHGTHTASTAGGSSVIIRGDSIVVTNAHDSATYGGMAPGADLWLAGINVFDEGYIATAFQHMVNYADTIGGTGMPLVMSNSWGANAGARDGIWSCSSFITEHYSDDNPNRIILFAAGNAAGNSFNEENGGFFVKKEAVNKDNTLGTILRSRPYTNTSKGYSYTGLVLSAYSSAHMACYLHVLDTTGAIVCTDTFANSYHSIYGLIDINANGDTILLYKGRNGGNLKIQSYKENGKYGMLFTANNFESQQNDTLYTDDGKFYKSHYTLAVEIFPDSTTADVNMWAGDVSYFSDLYQTPGHTWLRGTDDMCVCSEVATPEVISVGAYVSKNEWLNYQDSTVVESETLGDIASFSSYATPEMSPTGLAYPWITAPGSSLMAGVNHYHTTQVDEGSYYGPYHKDELVFNDEHNPYAAMAGTSMATPTAAGIVALWLQAAQEVGKDLTGTEVKEIMRLTAIHDSFTNGTYAARFGKGKIDALAGIAYILSHYGKLPLANNSANEDTISGAAATGKIYEVTLADRIFYKDSDWNTLCLPFGVDSFPRTVLEGATVMELDGATSNLTGTTLTLNFTAATSIEAGKPYLVRWPNDTVTPTFTNPVFENATVVAGPPSAVNFTGGSFVGSYSPVAFSAGDQTKLFMGACNTLYYPNENMTLGACRAHISLNNPSQAPSRIELNFNEDAPGTTTTVQTVKQPEKATKFFRNGHIYILRDGVTYDLMGKTITLP